MCSLSKVFFISGTLFSALLLFVACNDTANSTGQGGSNNISGTGALAPAAGKGGTVTGAGGSLVQGGRGGTSGSVATTGGKGGTTVTASGTGGRAVATGGAEDTATGGAGGSAGKGETGGVGGSAGEGGEGGTAGAAGGAGRDPSGPCADLELLCFDFIDMWLNPECETCNAGQGCQGCAIPFAY